MSEYKIIAYETENGKSPFFTWFNSIKNKDIQQRIIVRIDRLRKGNFGDTKSVGDNIYELRLFFGPGYRVYYTIEDNVLVLLLTGGDKSTQVEDIKKAKMYLKTYKGGQNDKV